LRHLERAQQFEQRRDWNNAMGFYREALHFRPNDPLCLEGLRRIQQFVATEQFYLLLDQAAQAEQRRDWNRAAQFYNEALRIRPADPAATQALRRLDELAAQQSFNAAMQRGAHCEQRQQWRQALDHYRDAQRVRPNDLAAADAIRRCEEQIRLEPYNDALQRASQAESGCRWREAADHYQRALNVKPGDSVATQGFQRAMYSDAMERGQQAEQRKDWATALQAYREAITHRPGDAIATEALRRVTENINKPQSQAPLALPPPNAVALDANPPPAPPSRTLSQNPIPGAPQQSSRRPADKPPPKAAPVADHPAPVAAPPLTAAQQAAFNDAINDALASEKKGKWLDAIGHYQRALEVIPDDPIVLRSIRVAKFNDAMQRGNLALRTGNRDEAVAAFRQAHALIPEDKTPVESLRRMGLRAD
jgi:tetratricopeptide (TPR) repeat protein